MQFVVCARSRLNKATMPDSDMQNLIIQFAKWPDLGKVKTRLAKDLGDEKACFVHCELMTQVAHNIATGDNYRHMLALSRIESGWPEPLAGLLSLMDHASIQLSEQVQGNLGDKMAAAITSNLKEYSKVVIVGSDCPAIDVEYLQAALTALDTNDIILGPAEDGGYVLIGARRFDPHIFHGVEWGSPQVREQTIHNAEQLGFSLGLLSLTWDVDELEDYERWRREELG